MKKIRSATKTETWIRRRSCLTRQAQRQPLRPRRHAGRSAATSEFTACQTGCCCRRVIHDGPDDSDFVLVAREAHCLDVQQQQQHTVRSAHQPPI